MPGKLSDREAALLEGISEALVQWKQQIDARFMSIECAQTRTLADAYRGSFAPNTHYERGALINDRGALWLAMCLTDQRPGHSSDWKLIIKAPR